MTSFELGNLIKNRLAAAGLSQYVDDAREQYLEFPDGFFAEVVLTDGSKLSEAQRLVNSIEEELRKQGIEVNAIVRALWELVGIEKAGIAPGGGQRFIATLRSGDRECRVTVDMTGNAVPMILGEFGRGHLREYGADRDTALRNIVSEFVRLELSYGGENYWNPALHPELVLNEDALSYLTMHSPAKAG